MPIKYGITQPHQWYIIYYILQLSRRRNVFHCSSLTPIMYKCVCLYMPTYLDKSVQNIEFNFVFFIMGIFSFTFWQSLGIRISLIIILTILLIKRVRADQDRAWQKYWNEIVSTLPQIDMIHEIDTEFQLLCLELLLSQLLGY